MSVRLLVVLLAGVMGALAPPALAQVGPPSPSTAASDQVGPARPEPPADALTPLSLVDGAAEAIPGFEGGLSGALNVLVLLTVLTLVPAIMVMCTCFVRFIIVLGLVRQAMGTNSMPPAQVVTALALFMTFMVMAPTMKRVHEEAILPYQRGEITNQIEMWDRAKQPIRDYMFAQIEATGDWSSLYMVLNQQGVDTSEPESLTRADVDTLALIPAYMLSELKTAFLMGFKVYLPFLVIDMVIASLLISMSMMMLPPPLISMPFKLLLFILADGWNLVVGSLMQTVAQVN